MTIEERKKRAELLRSYYKGYELHVAFKDGTNKVIEGKNDRVSKLDMENDYWGLLGDPNVESMVFYRIPFDYEDAYMYKINLHKIYTSFWKSQVNYWEEKDSTVVILEDLKEVLNLLETNLERATKWYEEDEINITVPTKIGGEKI